MPSPFLVTGTPGAGKTLNTIALLYEIKDRPIFYHGINGLTLPWTPIDDPKDIDFDSLPPGTILVIDEAQKHFPVRPPKEPPPAFCKYLETHRHRGHEVYLITQHPMLLDHHIRRLIGTHMFYQRLFGMTRATRYMADKLIDTDNAFELKQAEKQVINYPKKVYALYKSAEIHTVKSRLPKIVYVLPFLFLAIGYGIYHVKYKTLGSYGAKTDTSALSPSAASPSFGLPGAASAPVDWAKALKPAVPGLPYTAPIYAPIAKPVSLPLVAGCVGNDKKCSCYTQQATVIEMTSAQCQFYLKNSVFNPFRREQQSREHRQQIASNELQAEPVY